MYCMYARARARTYTHKCYVSSLLFVGKLIVHATAASKCRPVSKNKSMKTIHNYTILILHSHLCVHLRHAFKPPTLLQRWLQRFSKTLQFSTENRRALHACVLSNMRLIAVLAIILRVIIILASKFAFQL